MKTTTKTWAAFLMISLLTGCGMFKKDDVADDTDADEDAVVAVAMPVAGGQPSIDDGSSTHQPCVPGPAPVFTHDVTENAKIKSVTPLGYVGEAGRMIVGRSYVHLRDDLKGTHTSLAIYAPVDMKIVGGERNVDPNNTSPNPEAWAFQVEVTCNVSMYFAHLKTVVPKIAAAFPPLVAGETGLVKMYPSTTLEFKAGDKIGETYGDADTTGFDFVVSDKEVTETGYANPARYAKEDWRHQVCPWDRFTDDLKDIYYSKLGTPEAAIPGTSCGTVSADVKGTLVGEWHLDPIAANGPGELKEVPVGANLYGNPLPITERADGIVFVSHINGQNTRFVVEQPEKLPKDILTGTEYCYQLRLDNPTTDSGWVYFQMTSDMEMQVNYGVSGLCPASFPELNSIKYYR